MNESNVQNDTFLLEEDESFQFTSTQVINRRNSSVKRELDKLFLDCKQTPDKVNKKVKRNCSVDWH